MPSPPIRIAWIVKGTVVGVVVQQDRLAGVDLFTRSHHRPLGGFDDVAGTRQPFGVGLADPEFEVDRLGYQGGPIAVLQRFRHPDGLGRQVLGDGAHLGVGPPFLPRLSKIDVVDVAAGAVGHHRHEGRVEAIGPHQTPPHASRTSRSNPPRPPPDPSRRRSAASNSPAGRSAGRRRRGPTRSPPPDRSARRARSGHRRRRAGSSARGPVPPNGFGKANSGSIRHRRLKT